jgi:hypothetical protein
MSRSRILIGVGLIASGVVLAPWGRAAESPTMTSPTKTNEPSPPAERERKLSEALADARAEIDKLKQENKRLRNELRELKSQQPAIFPPAPGLSFQPPPPAIPKNGIPREFNGETYYLVPLTSGSGTLSIESGTPAGRDGIRLNILSQNHR